MKAEEALIAHGLNEYNCLAFREMIDCLEDYARIQIENDRKETKRLMNENLKDFEGINPEIEDIIDRPIILD